MPATEPQSRDDRRWNFWAALIDAGGWGLGMGMVSPTTILPLFVSQLTTAPIALGMIQTVMLLGWLGPGVLVSPWIDRLPRVKATVMSIAVIERLVMLLIAGFCIWLGPKHPEWLLVAFFAGV